ncbi:hypothetical protein [Novosphingobium sp.]|uniref:hypothetical protein n=1 Tax=Novosphingobium sp. TaxID=1874826 RepID=UPI0033420176
MEKPNYDRAVYSIEFPAFINNDGKSYFIFSQINEYGTAIDPVFYRDFALEGSKEIIETVIQAYIEHRKLKVFLEDHSGSLVKRVALGARHDFPGWEHGTIYLGPRKNL